MACSLKFNVSLEENLMYCFFVLDSLQRKYCFLKTSSGHSFYGIQFLHLVSVLGLAAKLLCGKLWQPLPPQVFST